MEKLDLQGAFWNTWAGSICVFVLNVCSNLLGGFDAMMVLLLIVGTYDVVIGSLFSLLLPPTEKLAYNSKVGFFGFMKKILMLATVSIAKGLDDVLGYEVIRNATVIYYVINNILSVFELHVLYNVPLPSFITKYLNLWIDKVGMRGEFDDKEENEHSN